MDQTRRTIGSGPLSRVDNEQGAALIIVLLMLLLLIILGTTLFNSSVTEIKVAGNYRNNLETFFAADAAVEFAMTYSGIYTSIYGNATTWPEQGHGAVLNDSFGVDRDKASDDPYKDYNQITIPGTTDKAQIKVELVKSKGNPPPGYGFQEDVGIGSGSGFKANQFAVTVIANGPNNARTDIESGVARIVP